MIQDLLMSFARQIAREAGQLACDLRRAQTADFVSEKGEMDFITQADRAVESLLRDRIMAAYPDHAILGEEEGGAAAGTFWIIDPIDGTTNYLKGLPDWGVCVALVQGGHVTHGVIACPDHGLVAHAAKGQGAFLNDAPIKARAQGAIAIAQVGYSARVDLGDHLEQLKRLIAHGADYRRSGAAGWADLFYERHLNLWDAAAGVLILSEAGGSSEHQPLERFAREGSPVLALGRTAQDKADTWREVFS